MDLNVKDVDFFLIMMSFLVSSSFFALYRTALHIAVIGNHKEAVKALVAAGAKKSLRDSQGMTARGLASNLHRVDLL
jgi:ankyrin repeat protein